MNTQSGRATPLPPGDRRTAILDAVIPLLVNKGPTVTTAEMAAAAGIAEGTIFRVFPDKAALWHAAIAKTMDPAPIEAALDEISAGAPLSEQLVAAARILDARYDRVTKLVSMVRSMPHADKPHAEAHRIATESMAAVGRALTRLLDRHRDQLRVEPGTAANLLRGLVFTNTHHLLSPEEQMTPTELVSVLSTGILAAENS